MGVEATEVGTPRVNASRPADARGRGGSRHYAAVMTFIRWRDYGEVATPRKGIKRELVTQRASCTAGTDEIEPDPAVFKLDSWTAEPSPPAHDDPAHGGIEDRDEIALHIRVHANGCTKRQEVIGNVPVRCHPAQMEIAY